MIRALVDFALNNRFIILIVAILLFVWGAISFHNLPVEAYPDVANNYVQIITQWPGRAAEEVEQQVTIPLEISMAGLPHMEHLRSVSLAGLSSLTLIFDDSSVNDWNREKVLERLSMVTLPAGLQPQIGSDWSPVGQIYWYTLVSTNPAYDNMELKSLEDWTLEKQFKSVPGVVDVSSFGGITREYQVRVDPDKLIAYGLSIGQVEQQLANNNTNAGGSFIEQGSQQINVREVGLFRNVSDIENTVLKTSNGTALRVKDIATVEQGSRIRLGQIGRAIHRSDGKIVDDSDVVEGIVLMQKGDDSDSTLAGIHAKVEELNNQILPKGVKIKPFLDRSDLLSYTLHTVLHNLTEGIVLVVIILFLFLGNVRGAIIVSLPSRLHCSSRLFVSKARTFPPICSRSARSISAWSSTARSSWSRTSCGTGTRRVENVAPAGPDREAAHEVQRPVFFARAIIVVAYLPIFTLQSVEGRLFKPMAWMVSFALIGSLVFAMLIAPVLATFLFRFGAKEWRNPVMGWLSTRYRAGVTWAIEHRYITVSIAVGALALTAFLGFSGVIGSEFLPHLDEGAIWVRGSLAPSTGPTNGVAIMNRARQMLASFPEVPVVISQVGRPDDGTDTTGFFNTEYFVDLIPKEKWRPVFHQNKDELIGAMDRELEKIPGVVWNFSQPISDNVEEAVSGVKGELAVKIYGADLKTLETTGNQIVAVMGQVQGIQDLGLFHSIGQPNLDYVVDRQAAARYGINVSDIQDAIQTAVGGGAVSQVLQGEARYDVVVRYQQPYRDTSQAISDIKLLSPSGERVPLSQLTDVQTEDGAEEIYREANERYVAIKYSVRGRDLGSTVREAMERVNRQVKLPSGYHLDWAGSSKASSAPTSALPWWFPSPCCSSS